jgi:hypothetical protein
MFGNKGLPTKHAKGHERFTRQILLHWRASCVSWAAFLREPSVPRMRDQRHPWLDLRLRWNRSVSSVVVLH